jgi:hypothetical protein
MGGILCSGILDGGKKALSVSNVCSLNLLHIFSLYRRNQVCFSFDVMAIGKCDGKVPIFWPQLPARVEYAQRSPGVQFIYPKCGVRNSRQGNFAPKPVQGSANIGTRSKVHIIRLTFTIIIVRITKNRQSFSERDLLRTFTKGIESVVDV